MMLYCKSIGRKLNRIYIFRYLGSVFSVKRSYSILYGQLPKFGHAGT